MASNTKIIEKSALVYVKEIGRGAFSNVYQMKWTSPNGPIDVAAKKLTRKDKHELEVLSTLDHPNIIKLIGVVDEGTDFMLVLELCEGGSLRSYLKARNGRRLSEEQFYEFSKQAVRPLEYLRENEWIHKDVKSPNYMLTSQNILKLGDFGLAKNFGQTSDNATTTASYQWMAPELLLEGILSPKYDIFALAVVLWELWTGRFPWEGVQNPTILWKVCNENKRLPIPEDCPKPFKNLLRQSWLKDWKQRPDISQILQVITSLSKVPSKAAPQEARLKKILDGPWKMVRGFGKQDGPGKLDRAHHMTLSPNGDVVIADYDTSQIKIYNFEGQYKSSIHTHRQSPWKVVVSSDNTCFMTDNTQHVAMYELSGEFKGEWVSSCPDASLSTPVLRGLALDHAGDVLLGDVQNRYIYRHKQDGTNVGSITVGIRPWHIAVTSKDTIVITDKSTDPQVISNKGQVLHTLKHPVDESNWNTYNLYCHDGIIFVCNTGCILCFSESGKYLGSMSIPSMNPRGLAMTSDSKTLLVCEPDSVMVCTVCSMHQ